MKLAKRLILGTPLERPARWVWSLLAGNGSAPQNVEWLLRDARDSAYVRSLFHYELRGANCIDIGAHNGAFLDLFLEFAPDGRHFAFEPIPDLAARLRRNYPGVAVHECALSDRKGRAEFNFVPELPGWSGLRPQPYPFKVSPQKISVALNRLDDLIPPDVSIRFIKIDVEGAELEVLKGAHDLLDRARPIVLFECARIHHEFYDTKAQDVWRLFSEHDMGVYLMDNSGPLTEEEFIRFYDLSHATNYNRHAWGNYLARGLR